MSHLPTQSGPDTITRELGCGGTGAVCLTTGTRLDRQAAIEALPAEILDFGLAKSRPEPGSGSTEFDSALFTEEGVVLGTPTYMSPEQARAWSFHLSPSGPTPCKEETCCVRTSPSASSRRFLPTAGPRPISVSRASSGWPTDPLSATSSG